MRQSSRSLATESLPACLAASRADSDSSAARAASSWSTSSSRERAPSPEPGRAIHPALVVEALEGLSHGLPGYARMPASSTSTGAATLQRAVDDHLGQAS